MRFVKMSFVCFLVLIMGGAVMNPAAAQEQNYSNSKYNYTLQLPSGVWRLISEPDEIHQHAEFVYGDRNDGFLRIRKEALEEGLTSIDSEIACPPCGQIDLLGLSRSNQLTIIAFNTNADEWLLIRGLGHVDWVTRNMPIIRRLYPSHTIDYSLPPALMLVAPQFSPALRSVARQVRCPTIKWIRYCALESSVGLGIFFERIEGE